MFYFSLKKGNLKANKIAKQCFVGKNDSFSTIWCLPTRFDGVLPCNHFLKIAEPAYIAFFLN